MNTIASSTHNKVNHPYQFNHIRSLIQANQTDINYYHDTLKKYGIVNITDCFDHELIRMMTSETHRIFDLKSKRKDFISQHTQTPRHMCVVSECEITEESKIITDFYYSEEVLALLSNIAGEDINYLPWTGERYVINGLINERDTHGWHWDDYAYALIFIAHNPPKGGGGEVECVARTTWVKANPDIQSIVAKNPIKSYYFESGSFYLMRSDTTLHRVTTISSPYKRLSIAMSYCNLTDLEKPIDHKTVLDLYG